MLPGSGLFKFTNEPHAKRAVCANYFKSGQCLRIIIDLVLQLSPLVSNIFSPYKDGWDTCIDHSDLQGTKAWHRERINEVARGEHGACSALFFCGRVHKFEGNLGGREGHAVELKIPRLLDLTIGDWNVGDDGLTNIGLPDSDNCNPVIRNS